VSPIFFARRVSLSGCTTVVNAFQKILNVKRRIIEISISFQVNFFALESAHEAFRQGIVVWVAAPTHADADAVGL
jgi:hypothetical protein